MYLIRTTGRAWCNFAARGDFGTSQCTNSMCLYVPVGRSIKAGLTACDIVSKWTWAATLLQVGMAPPGGSPPQLLQSAVQQ
jgi:hypothetical protein